MEALPACCFETASCGTMLQTRSGVGSLAWTSPIATLEGAGRGRNIGTAPGMRAYRGYFYVLQRGSPCLDAGALGDKDSIRWPSRYRNGVRADTGAYGGAGGVGWRK